MRRNEAANRRRSAREKKKDDDKPKPKRLVRWNEAIKRLAMGRTKFDRDIVKAGLLKFFPIGARAKACVEEDLDALIDGIAAGKIKLGEGEEEGEH